MEWPDVVDAARDAVARIWSEGLTGTAFHISGEVFVTSKHVIGSAPQVELVLPIGVKMQAQPAANAGLASVDLALLRPTSPQNVPKVALADMNAVRVGEEVLFAGYPLDAAMPLTFHKAMVAFIGHRAFPPIIQREVACLQLDGSVNLGNSGGPVFNREGKVIGVVSARYGKLTEFLDAFLKDQTEARDIISQMGMGTVQINAVPVGDKTYTQFDVVEAQNAFIDIVSMLQRHTNVGIGWAVSSAYIAQYF